MIFTFVTNMTINTQQTALLLSFEDKYLIKDEILIKFHHKKFSSEAFKFLLSMIFGNNIRMTINAAFKFLKQ